MSFAPTASPDWVLNPVKLLLVEDDRAYADFLRATLESDPRMRVDLIHVTRLADASAELETADVVLLDLMLPDGNGYEWLVQQKHTREMPPVVVLTNVSDEGSGLAAMSAGAQDYLVKSEADTSTLVRAVRYSIERHRVRNQLHAAGQRFRHLIENALDLITIIDAEGVVTYTSPSSTRLLGFLPDRLIGSSLFDVVHPEDVTTVRTLVHDAVDRPGVALSGELRLRHADNSWHTLEVIAQRVPDALPVEVVFNARDVTERKQAEAVLRDRDAQLRQAQKMEAIGRLAGGIAHDFSNLLTVIIGASEHLIEGLSSDDPLYKDVESIRKSGDRAASMTRQLLAFSRQQMLAPADLNLNDVLVTMARLLRRLIGEDIELQTICPPALGLVRADRTQLEQVLLNLAINARDAMPDGGRLIVETQNVGLGEDGIATELALPAGRYVCVSVSDTGTGMDAETQAHAFEPFFTTKDPGKGTGLGLSTVYGIVKQSGGSVTVRSMPGLGTSVLLYLPRVNEASLPGPISKMAGPARGGTETVLLVEDEADVRDLVREMLELAGYAVVEADRPIAAQEICRRHAGPIELLLTDVVMPELTGRDLADSLAAVRPDMKVLFMSGYTHDAVAPDGVLEPGTNFVGKPFTRQTLLQKIREVLDQSETR